MPSSTLPDLARAPAAAAFTAVQLESFFMRPMPPKKSDHAQEFVGWRMRKFVGWRMRKFVGWNEKIRRVERENSQGGKRKFIGLKEKIPGWNEKIRRVE